VNKLIQTYQNKLRQHLKWILIGIVVFFLFFTLIGFFALPPVLKFILVNKLSENLLREVTITQIKVNPYVLSLTVRGLLVKERGSPETFISCEEIFLNLQSLSALKMALVL